jgi:hypothetical protein
VSTQATLTIDRDPHHPGSECVCVRDLHPDLIASLRARPAADRLLQSTLRVRVVEEGVPEGEDIPDVFGRHQVLESGIRFAPHFPFDSGVRFRATFDPQPLGCPGLSKVLTHEFSIAKETSVAPTQVKHAFPSSDTLPENLLRFYVCFSNPMQRGRAEEQIRLLGPDGQPAPDTLYRPPVELWDRSMRHLTILLDPGRLKRRVGPNRKLGPPLKAGQKYTLAIGSGMIDFSGRSLGKSFFKSFLVTEADRQPVAVEQWKIVPPATKSNKPLTLIFPKPLDWALLWHTITVAPEGGRPIDGRVTIDQGETQWSFTPASAWSARSYRVRIAASLEDVCGNSLHAAFDRPLRSASDLVCQAAEQSMSFHLV